jgi:hypothetical protein
VQRHTEHAAYKETLFVEIREKRGTISRLSQPTCGTTSGGRKWSQHIRRSDTFLR